MAAEAPTLYLSSKREVEEGQGTKRTLMLSFPETSSNGIHSQIISQSYAMYGQLSFVADHINTE